MINFSSDMLSAAAADEINNSLLMISNRLQCIVDLMKFFLVMQFGKNEELILAINTLDKNIQEAEHSNQSSE